MARSVGEWRPLCDRYLLFPASSIPTYKKEGAALVGGTRSILPFTTYPAAAHMAGTPHWPILLLSVLLVTFSRLPSPAMASRASVISACQQVDKPDVCQRILLPAPWAVACGDVRCLVGNIIPRAAQPKATAARDYVEKLQGSSPPEMADALSSCLTSYNEVLSNLEDTLEQFNAGSFSEAEATTASAEDQISSCENAFSRKPTPMTSRNTELTAIVSLTGDLLDILNQ